MAFTLESIAFTLFSSLVTALGTYFAFYVKTKAELRAAAEDLKLLIENQTKLTKAIENEKMKVSSEGAIGAEARKCIYELVAAVQSLLHSMCWLGWDTMHRSKTRVELTNLYDLEHINCSLKYLLNKLYFYGLILLYIIVPKIVLLNFSG